MAATDDVKGAFGALRSILHKHSKGMIVHTDTAANYTLQTPAIGENKQPVWFGAVMLKKSAVTYHLFPLYFNPKLQARIDKELLPRRQGKTCFNFKRPDADLFARLDALTAAARDHFERAGFLKPGPISKETADAALRSAGEDPKKIAAKRKRVAKAAAIKRAATIRKKQAAK